MRVTFTKICLLLFLIVTFTEAGVAKGKLLFDKKLRAGCEMSAGEMSRKHTQEEWKILYKKNLLSAEISRICPDVKPIKKKKQLKNLYQLFRTFAKDSKNIPSD